MLNTWMGSYRLRSAGKAHDPENDAWMAEASGAASLSKFSVLCAYPCCSQEERNGEEMLLAELNANL
jgi:hypothetical protein